MLRINQEYMSKLEEKIQNILDGKESGDLESMLSIYTNLNTILTQQTQIAMMEESRKMMKDVDLSKVDIGSVLNKFLGK